MSNNCNAALAKLFFTIVEVLYVNCCTQTHNIHVVAIIGFQILRFKSWLTKTFSTKGNVDDTENLKRILRRNEDLLTSIILSKMSQNSQKD